MISYPFWQREFGGTPDAVGRDVMLDGRPFRIIGISAPEFFGVEVGTRYDVAVPLCADPLFFTKTAGIAYIPCFGPPGRRSTPPGSRALWRTRDAGRPSPFRRFAPQQGPA